jgi:hypothetical protein
MASGQRPAMNSSLAVLAEISEPSLLLMDFLLTMQTTAMDVTWSYGAQQAQLDHRVTCSNPGAAVAVYDRTSVRRLLFLTFADRRTMVSGILMAK